MGVYLRKVVGGGWYDTPRGNCDQMLPILTSQAAEQSLKEYLLPEIHAVNKGHLTAFVRLCIYKSLYSDY